MEQTHINKVLLRNVGKLSRIDEREESMMPKGASPLPEVDEVRRIVTLAKSIVFTDYFYKRQPDEQIRAYYIGVYVEELYAVLRRQIARGLQFCEDCAEPDVLSSVECLTLVYPNSLVPSSATVRMTQATFP